MSRYDVPGGEDAEFEPGSQDRVLRNRLGIIDSQVMELEETQAYARMVLESLESLEDDQKLLVQDIRQLHRTWLGSLYNFAGEYRTVNLSKNGFAFCLASYVPEQMNRLDELLNGHTPCSSSSMDELARVLATIHGEFILIHPFREGNGRLGRWLASLMALQAGLPILDFQAEEESLEAREIYFSAIRRFPTDERPLQEWFTSVFERL